MPEDRSARAPARRPGGRNARVRSRILAATAESIARDGIGGLRYEQIATLAGVNKTSVYRNWPDRRALLADALTSFSADAAPLHDTGDIDADLIDFLEAFAAAVSSPRGRALLNVVGTAYEDPDLRDVLEEAFAQRMAMLCRRVEAAVERGQLPAVDCRLLSEMLTGPVYGLTSRGAREFTRSDAERVTTIVLGGVRATAVEEQHG